MKVTGPGPRLTIFLSENDTWHHRPLHAELVHRAHQAGLAGAPTARSDGDGDAGGRL